MKIEDVKKEPTYRLIQFIKGIKDDEVERLSEVHKKLGISRNRVAWYVATKKVPMVIWNGYRYIGTKKSIEGLKKLGGTN